MALAGELPKSRPLLEEQERGKQSEKGDFYIFMTQAEERVKQEPEVDTLEEVSIDIDDFGNYLSDERSEESALELGTEDAGLADGGANSVTGNNAAKLQWAVQEVNNEAGQNYMAQQREDA